MMKGRRVGGAGIVAVLAAVLAVVPASARPSATPGRLLAPEDAKLDTRLRTLGRPAEPATGSSSLVLQPLDAIHGSKARVFVYLESASPRAVAQLIRAGFKVERVNLEHRLVRGKVRTKDLRRLARLSIVRSVEPVRSGFLHTGSVTSEGDAASGAPQARATGFDGTGVTVGVISDGVDRLGLSIASGNLAADTSVPIGLGCGAGSGDEGTAMLEIVHDLAPGATLRFSEGFSDKLAFIDSVTCLRNAGAQVIVDDIGFFDEPFFEDGVVADAVRTAVEAGVSYHTAAGNSGASHYGATFRGTATPDGTFHAFTTGANPDTFQRMEVASGGTVQCVLQWNDKFGDSNNDYDLELWDLEQDPPVLVDISVNAQTGTQNPLEVVGPAQNLAATTAHAGVRVRRVSGVDRQLSLFCRGGSNLLYQTPAGSIFGHSALGEVVTVGAIDVADFGLDNVEPFSSQGPVSILFPVPETREKPDLVAFDGVTTSICPSASLCFDPFFGTSAAAPHSAAVAALWLSKNSCQTPAQIQQALAAGADDILTAGFDDASGAGRLNAFKVLSAPWACDDGNPCTRDTCSPGTGCQHAVLADGDPCPDGNLCNGDETCQTGSCTAGTPLVCNDSNPCTTDTCNPTRGCLFIDACDDGDPCTTDTCDPVAGCQHTAAPDGTPCPDTDLCNGTETCKTGVCAPGPALVCNDGDPCSTDTCDTQAGCQSASIEGFSGITCLCGQGLTPGACGAAVAPRATARRFARACNLVARASGGVPRRRARRLLNEAARTMGKAARPTDRAARRGALPTECAMTIDGLLDDAQGRIIRLSAGL